MKNLKIQSILLVLVLISGTLVNAQTKPEHKIEKGKFEASWESFEKNYTTPDWFRDAKFGIWAYWSVQCVPEAGDWYARGMYIQGDRYYNFHVAKYGHPSKFGFMELINLWKADNWKPEELMDLYKEAGAKYFCVMANQGRPSVNKYFMDMHVRKLFWTNDGWPVASPERYAWENNNLITQAFIIGDWERIVLNYHVVQGYQVEQANPDLQVSEKLTIDAAGTLNGDPGNKWYYTAPWLQLSYSNGTVEKLFVQKGRDWENKIDSCLIFTGLNNLGIAIWGKTSNKLQKNEYL